MNFFQKESFPKKNFSLITTLFQMEGSGIIWEKLFCNQHPFINQRSTLRELEPNLAQQVAKQLGDSSSSLDTGTQ